MSPKLIIERTIDAESVDLVIRRKRESEILFLNSDELLASPQPATTLSVVSLTATTVDLDWDASISNVDSYTVYVYNNATGTLEQTITGIVLTEAEVMGLTQDDEYEFWVTAVRSSVESVESNHVTATPVDVVPPAIPTGLTEDAVTIDTISISWDANAEPDLAGYNIYVDTVKVNGALIVGESDTIENLSESTEYDINITAVDTSGNESVFSNTLVSTTASSQPDPPTNLEVSIDEVTELESSDGTMVIGTDKSTTVEDICMGKVEWITDPELLWKYGDYSNHSGRVAVRSDGKILIGIGDDGSSFAEGEISLREPDGTIIWTKTGYGNIRNVRFDVDGYCYLSANETTKTVVKFDPADGTELDSVDITGVDARGFALDRLGNFYVGGRTTNVRKYDSDMNLVWTSADSFDIIESGGLACSLDSRVYVVDDSTSNTEYLFELDVDDGSVVWSLDNGSGTNRARARSIVITDSYLYISRWDALEEVSFDGVVQRLSDLGNAALNQGGWYRPDYLFFMDGSQDLIKIDIATLSREGTTSLGNIDLPSNPRSIQVHPGLVEIEPLKSDTNFTWDAVSGVDGYNLYESVDGGAYVKKNTSLITQTTYSSDELSNGNYNFYVTAVENGVESDPSNIVNVQVGPQAYTYYKYSQTANVSNTFFVAHTEIPLHDEVGGSTVAPTIGGTASTNDNSANIANVFDGDFNNDWFSNSNPPFPVDLIFEFDEPVAIVEYGVGPYPTNFHPRSPQSWNFYGSNDGVNWDLLDEQSGVTDWSDDTFKYYEL